MKKLIFGLILAFSFLLSVPVNAHQLDVGMKKEINTISKHSQIVSLDAVAIVPQVHFVEPCISKYVDKWNFNSIKFKFVKSEYSSFENTLIVDNRNALCNAFNFLDTIKKSKTIHYNFIDPCRQKNK